MHAYMTWHDMTIYFMFTFAFNFTFTVTVAVTVTVTVADTFIFLFAITFRLHTHIGWPDIHIPAGCVAGLHGVKGRAEEQRTAVSFHAEGWSNQDFEHAFSGVVIFFPWNSGAPIAKAARGSGGASASADRQSGALICLGRQGHSCRNSMELAGIVRLVYTFFSKWQ